MKRETANCSGQELQRVRMRIACAGAALRHPLLFSVRVAALAMVLSTSAHACLCEFDESSQIYLHPEERHDGSYDADRVALEKLCTIEKIAKAKKGPKLFDAKKEFSHTLDGETTSVFELIIPADWME